MMNPVHVLGASGRSGAALCRSLLADGVAPVPVVRNPARWAATGIAGPPRVADLTDPAALRTALADATAHRLLRPCPPRRRGHRRRPAAGAPGVPRQHAQIHPLAGRARQRRAGRRGRVPRLRPPRRDAAPDDDLRRRRARTTSSASPPCCAACPSCRCRAAARALVQPIHQDDCHRAPSAPPWTVQWDGPHSLVIAGPTALPYADFVRAVAAAAGLRRRGSCRCRAGAAARRRAADPAAPVAADASAPAEIRRLLEDKAFDIAPHAPDRSAFTHCPLARGPCTHLRAPQEPNRPNEPHAVINRIAEFHADMTAWRHDLHAHPELGAAGDPHQRGRAGEAARVRRRRDHHRHGADRRGRRDPRPRHGRTAPSACAPTWTRCRSMEETGLPYASQNARRDACLRP